MDIASGPVETYPPTFLVARAVTLTDCALGSTIGVPGQQVALLHVALLAFSWVGLFGAALSTTCVLTCPTLSTEVWCARVMLVVYCT